MKSPWIKRFYNDPRDYLIKTHEIAIPETQIEFRPPEYDPHKKYEVVLCEDRNEVTGEVTYVWLEESKNKFISPHFPSRQLAEYWMRQNEK